MDGWRDPLAAHALEVLVDVLGADLLGEPIGVAVAVT